MDVMDRFEMISLPAGAARVGSTPDDVERCVREWSGRLVSPDYTEEKFRTWILKECPRWSVPVGAFAVSRYPVTNAWYAEFVRATGAREPESMRAREPGRHPVWGVHLARPRPSAPGSGSARALRSGSPRRWSGSTPPAAPGGGSTPSARSSTRGSATPARRAAAPPPASTRTTTAPRPSGSATSRATSRSGPPASTARTPAARRSATTSPTRSASGTRCCAGGRSSSGATWRARRVAPRPAPGAAVSVHWISPRPRRRAGVTQRGRAPRTGFPRAQWACDPRDP